jgi:hypothetical protein
LVLHAKAAASTFEEEEDEDGDGDVVEGLGRRLGALARDALEELCDGNAAEQAIDRIDNVLAWHEGNDRASGVESVARGLYTARYMWQQVITGIRKAVGGALQELGDRAAFPALQYPLTTRELTFAAKA